MNLKKKIKRAVENNDNVKGINVISSFLERRMNIFVIVFHALDFFFRFINKKSYCNKTFYLFS
jgi:preprotein translocase subunit SecG